MKFKLPKVLVWICASIALIVIVCWGYLKYDNIIFLRYGVLHINKFPESLRIINHETYGASDFCAEYYCSINSVDFNKLLSGKKYILKSCNNTDLTAIATMPESKSFPTTYCYISGSMGNGLVRLFTNKDRTLIYAVYWVN